MAKIVDTESKDEIIEEVRRIKESLAASVGFDVGRIVANAKRTQLECGHEIIHAPVRQKR